ncbi:MAG: DUF1302 domain-containing protein [Thermoanaerobaculia bacterium]|nr:DUF1302 domain-containing protein [Thermoanaerobaculia bacterium]
MRSWIERNPRRTATRALLLVALLLPLAAPAFAVDGVQGDLSWSWGNTVSYGLLWRLDDADPQLVARSVPGGKALSANGDDGNLNYDTGIASNAVKWSSELELRYKRVGAFVRGFAFYDYENEEGDRARTPLSSGALDRVGSRAEIRDAFVWWDFDLGDNPGSLRLGRQVINWGESTFIQGGINAINPVDVSALRVPGSELRDALLPIGAALLSLKPSENTSLELFYQYDWEETQVDPVGSYFSTSDLAGEGATKVMLGFGAAPDSIPVGAPIPGNPVGAVVPRAATRDADDGGQYGAALRLFLPAAGGTELGFYYLNYHSRLPLIMARTGSAAGLLVNGNYASSASYFLTYPEDIALYGLSFNAELGGGIALQGELSHKVDVPLQVDDVELLYAALTPLRLLPAIPQLAPVIGLGGLLASTNQLGAFGFGEEIAGFRRFDTSQIQLTATKAWSRTFGADQFILVGEAAYGKVHDMPDQTELRLEAPGTYTSGNPIHTLAGVQPSTERSSAFPTDTAWGYVLAGRLDYNNAMGAVNMSPRFSWAHDVSGISPGPGGNFLEGRKALTLGLGFQYQINWEWDVSYTKYFGAGRYNLINDRDFLAANIKYSF